MKNSNTQTAYRKGSPEKEDNKGNEKSSSPCLPENAEKVNSEKLDRTKYFKGNTSEEDCSFLFRQSTEYDGNNFNTDASNQCPQNPPRLALIRISESYFHRFGTI